MSVRNYKHSGNNINSAANFRQAVDIEDAAHAINQINRRIRLDKKAEDYERHKAKVTLSRTMDAWLAKEIP